MAFPASPVLKFCRAASEQEARLLASKQVEPEHLFLALLWPEATTDPTVLPAYGITLQRARVAIHEMATWGGEPLNGALAVAVTTERAYEIAARYAEGNPVQHSDLLVGVLSVRSPSLERLLVKLGVTRSHLRSAIQQTETRRRQPMSRSTDSTTKRIDAAPPPTPAPDVVDLRPQTGRPAIALPGNTAEFSADSGRAATDPADTGPDVLEGHVDQLAERVEALIAQVERLLDERMRL